MVCSITITERRHKMRQQIQVLGFYLAGFLCLVLAVLKLTIERRWSWCVSSYLYAWSWATTLCT